MSIRQDLDPILKTFEKGLNVAGYIPGVQLLSSPVRGVYGKLQVVISLAIAALKFISSIFAKGDVKVNLRRESVICLSYTVHGLANMGRAVIEGLSFLSLVTCLPYDLFKNRLTYEFENRALLIRS